jgi:hypothetical protein
MAEPRAGLQYCCAESHMYVERYMADDLFGFSASHCYSIGG